MDFKEYRIKSLIMKRNIFSLSLLIILGFIYDNCFSQNRLQGGAVFFYEKVERYQYNDTIGSFIFIDSIKTSKPISIDPFKIFIKSFDQNSDLSLKIIDFEMGNNIEYTLYMCEADSCRCVFFTTKDFRESILYFNNQKLIFFNETEQKKEKEQHIYVSSDRGNNPDEIVYIDISLDTKPKYKNSLTFEASLQNFQTDLEDLLKLNCDTTNNNEIFISFIITKEGRISKASITSGSQGEADSCIISAIESMAGWTPGMMKDKKVTSICFISINAREKQ